MNEREKMGLELHLRRRKVAGDLAALYIGKAFGHDHLADYQRTWEATLRELVDLQDHGVNLDELMSDAAKIADQAMAQIIAEQAIERARKAT
jgi:plasmid stabilization system protein ParE